jgi:hypothetical protein
MTAKKTELDKRQGLAIANQQRRAGNAYGTATPVGEDRKTRRERERAAGLVPFAVKLPKELVAALQARAQGEGRDVDSVTADLLRASLESAAVSGAKTGP